MEWTEKEIQDQLVKWRIGQDPPMYQGAVPDMFKLNSTIQVDANELWWRGSKCDLCEYEAAYLDENGYRCWQHRSGKGS